jgi:hypothetical protein
MAPPAPTSTRRVVADVAASRRTLAREAVVIAAGYLVFSVARDSVGSARVSPALALAHARTILRIERHLGIDIERSVQTSGTALPGVPTIATFAYLGLHLLVTGAVLATLIVRAPERYRTARAVLAIATALALVGFVLFPVLPPRLLPASYGFVDTVRRTGGPSMESGLVRRISNQYAAMPSLHMTWALWSTVALWPLVRARGARAAVAAYPVAVLGVILVTGNHYVLDAVGGAVDLAAAWVIFRAWTWATASVTGHRRAGGSVRLPVATETAGATEP